MRSDCVVRRTIVLLATCVTASWAISPAAAVEPSTAPVAETASLRAAIDDLCAAFPDRYKAGPEYRRRLDAIDALLITGAKPRQDEARRQLEALRREALLANPLVSGQPILFVARRQYANDHHNTETMFQTGEINTGSFVGGGAIRKLSFRFPSAGDPNSDNAVQAVAQTILAVPEGVARDVEMHFDGVRIVFSMRRNRADDYHIYEIRSDGTGLRQLTSGGGVSDIDPIYLPTEEIVFTSTREPKYCMCNRHIMGNLFKMGADGSSIHQLGRNTLHEGHAALLPDGRILYDRWEYVDRNFGNAQGSWTVNPDGTQPLVYYGNSTDSPGAVLDARPIPGTQRMIATFSSCHDRPWGAIAIVDRRLGVDGRAPVLRTWPASAINLVDRGNYDTFTQVNPKYEDPYPLSDKYFLCSRMTGRGEQMGIYLLDVFGNELLVHVEGEGCFDPMPLSPRERPPVIPSRVDVTRSEGTVFVTDVYRGSGMERIPRGTVKHLRVVESPEKRFWTTPAWDGGTGQQAPGMSWDDFNNKRILGTVPVEADGSVSFVAPADRFVYFQLLDERGMMVQTMRSGTIVRPGETIGCNGCHEPRMSGGGPDKFPAAMRRAPRRLEPWYGPERMFGFLAEVQPVLDKHCVGCHNDAKPEGKKLNLAGDKTLIFNNAYIELRRSGQVRVVGAGPPQVLPPLSWGSHVSPLAKVLLEGHKDAEVNRQIRLDKEAMDRILTWIDINAPYYPDYASVYPENLYGRAPITMAELGRLGQLTGLPLADRSSLLAVNFTRPEASPCLSRIADRNGAAYREAVDIIGAGKRRIAAQPDVDMPGFRLSVPGEVARQVKYDQLREAERNSRRAMAQGGKKP